MKILFFGDIYGRVGRKAFLKNLEELKKKYTPDIIIANIDNITSGRGALPDHIKLLHKEGIHFLTGGDHIFDNFTKIKDCVYDAKYRLLVPSNIDFCDWKKYYAIHKNGETIVVLHFLGQVFMPIRSTNPFLLADELLEEINKKFENPTIFVDFHTETTAEVYGLAYYLEGRVDAVIGTHTHIQTSDLGFTESGKTLVMADAGMCGPKYSVIGAQFESVKSRFLTGITKGRIEQCLDNHYLVQGMFFEKKKGVITNFESIQISGIL